MKKTENVTTTPEDWGNLYFPEGLSTLEEVEAELDSTCNNGHTSRWTQHGNNCYAECVDQLIEIVP